MKMKNVSLLTVSIIFAISCGTEGTGDAASAIPTQKGGQSTVADEDSKPDVVKIAISSPDHTTLVAALKAADYVDALSNAGPFTVFAPVNAAFDALPAGTVEGLLKKEKQADLRNILEYHVYVGVLKPEYLQDGQTYGMASGHNVSITKSGEDIQVNGASVKGTVEGTNGIIYVIDKVLLPPQ